MSEPEELRRKAAAFRALAAEARDPDTRDALIALAEDFEAEAAAAGAVRPAEPSPRPQAS
jgi:hypothetical protein